MNERICEITKLIKEKALSIGFDACGVCRAEHVGEAQIYFQNWIQKGLHGSLDYLERNSEKRFNPTLLVEGTKSIISVALNYYPQEKQDESVPQFAYYAYGHDYHDVVKEKLSQLLAFIQTLIPEAAGRCFTDSAPFLESYWATRAGIGYKGRNTLLIIPGKGSFFFLGEILLNIELAYDKPQEKFLCGKCTKCIDACPTGALQEGKCMDARKCISYQTIENKTDEIDSEIASKLSNRVYGCDICQQVCPWNKKARPHQTAEFVPSPEFLNLNAESISSMSEEDFRIIFKGSAIKRAKHKGLMRNIRTLTQHRRAKDE